MRLSDAAAAVRFAGAEGGVGVVADTIADIAETLPDVSAASTP
jgi:hypothetical protein